MIYLKDNMITIEETNFEFRFLIEDRARSSVTRKVTSEDGTSSKDEPMFWMKVGTGPLMEK